MQGLRQELFGDEVVVENSGCYCRLGAPHRLCELIAERGYTVVNAPRPLACFVEPIPDTGRQRNFEWMGEFRHGTFYAAGPLDGPTNPFRPNGQKFRDAWRSNDAWPVRLTTNAEIEAGLRAYFAEHYPIDDGYTMFEEAVDALGGMAGLCDAYDLPWRE